VASNTRGPPHPHPHPHPRPRSHHSSARDITTGSPTSVGDGVSNLSRPPRPTSTGLFRAPRLVVSALKQGSPCCVATNVPEAPTKAAAPLLMGRSTTGNLYNNLANLNLKWLNIPILPDFDKSETICNHAGADVEVARRARVMNVGNHADFSVVSLELLAGGRSNKSKHEAECDGEQRELEGQTAHTPPCEDDGEPCLAPKRARKGRAKTEICRYYLKGKTCPFRDMCSYAHGHEELRAACLKDLVQDETEAADFRCRPCQTFVATGDW
jgi:hypothetical protein